VSDADGNTDEPGDTTSVFNGPSPVIRVITNEKEEIKFVSGWISERMKSGVAPQECGVFVRSAAELDRARAAIKESGFPFKVLDEHVETTSGHISISTMHLAKGLEFRAVGNHPLTGGGGMDSTHRLPAIIQFYRRQQRMPSLGELQRLCGFKSRTAAEKVAGRLVTSGLLAKDKTGRLLPTVAFSAVRFSRATAFPHEIVKAV
jgi:hypothetical protein